MTYPTSIDYCEDVVFNMRLLAHPIRIAYLPKAFYHYVRYENPNSLVYKRTTDGELALLDIYRRELPFDVFTEVLPNLAYGLAWGMLRSRHPRKCGLFSRYATFALLSWRAMGKNRHFIVRLFLLLVGWLSPKRR